MAVVRLNSCNTNGFLLTQHRNSEKEQKIQRSQLVTGRCPQAPAGGRVTLFGQGVEQNYD